MLEVGMHSLKCVGFKDVRLSSSMHDPNRDGEEMLGGDDGLFNLAQTFLENGIVTKVHSAGVAGNSSLLGWVGISSMIVLVKYKEVLNYQNWLQRYKMIKI